MWHRLLLKVNKNHFADLSKRSSCGTSFILFICQIGDQNAATRFSVAANKLASLANTPEPVKSILDNFTFTIVDLRQCVVEKITKCLRDAVRDVGIVGMVNGIKSTDGDLQALFWRMFDADLEAFGKMYGLTKQDGDAAVQCLFDLFDKKTDYINTYLEKQQRQ